MPRYFFHVHNGRELPDDQGTELTDLAAARAHALHYAGDLLSEEPASFWQTPEWRLEVSEGGNGVRFALHVFALDHPVIVCSRPHDEKVTQLNPKIS